METVVAWMAANILPLLLTLLVGLGVDVARRYIRRIKNEDLRDLLLDLVMAAEQKFGPGAGKQKASWVRAEFNDRVGRAPTEAELESAVFQVTR